MHTSGRMNVLHFTLPLKKPQQFGFGISRSFGVPIPMVTELTRLNERLVLRANNFIEGIKFSAPFLRKPVKMTVTSRALMSDAVNATISNDGLIEVGMAFQKMYWCSTD
jgi:hypothetical protein